jgi:hypothetical protein
MEKATVVYVAERLTAVICVTIALTMRMKNTETACRAAPMSLKTTNKIQVLQEIKGGIQ